MPGAHPNNLTSPSLTPCNPIRPFRSFSGSKSVATGAGGFAFGAKYVQQVAAAVPATRGGSGSRSEAAAAAAPRAAVIPPDLDGELAQQLHKLTKRDATTKLKALQALRALASSKPADDVVAALPPWAYLYSRLAMDGSRSVRAEAGQAMGALAAAAGRRTAPFLRALLPPWWLAQFDVAADVAAAARAAFSSAFATEAKRRDALLYCRIEVRSMLRKGGCRSMAYQACCAHAVPGTCGTCQPVSAMTNNQFAQGL